MIKDQLDLFRDRQEAIALFQQLSDRQAGQPWALLPILTLVGPSGYGKSLFLQHLYFHYCNPTSLPHASLDFGRPGAPHDMLNILGALRNSLQRQRDEHGRTLTFPRFDIIYARLKRSEGQEEEEIDEIEALLDDLIGLAGNIHFVLGFMLFVLKLIMRLPPLRSLLRWLVDEAYQQAGKRPQWRWYQDQVRKFRELNLPKDASVGSILRRLNEMCTLGEPEREFLIEQILPKAFLADLRYGAYDSESVMLREGPRCVVIFLDSFEVLLRSAESTARQLLEALALNEYRKRGESDPLLLMVASEERLPDMSRDQLNRHVSLATDTKDIQQRTRILYEDWIKQLPPQAERPMLRLRHIYLPLPLPTLDLDATRDYLLRFDQYSETHVFTNEALIEDIYQATQGYPIFLERVAAALQASSQNYGYLIQDTEGLFASEQGEQIVDRLLALHCKQVDERTFMLSAVPRTLTPELLRLVLDLPDANALNAEWRRYRLLPFLLASEDNQHITFIPEIRTLFLKKLQIIAAASDSDYLSVHHRLSNYFAQRIEQSLKLSGTRDERDLLERSYHDMALGNYQSVLQLASYAQQNDPVLWEHLLEVIAQAPTQKLPRAEIERLASEALYQARQHGTSAEAVRAIVLYTWLLVAPGSERKHVSSLWYDLGTAYQYLQKIDPNARRDAAAFCYQRANQLLDPPPPPPPTRRTIPLPGIQPPPPLQQRLSQLIGDTYRAVRANRRAQIILSIVLICAVLAPVLVPRLLSHPTAPPTINTPDNPYALPLAQVQPGVHSQWIGITVEPDKEYVGLSDGSIPFDYLRPDGSLKIRAASQLRQGNISGARATLQQAVQNDVNDAEALIYLQNIQVRLSGKSCTIFVVVTRIIEDTSEGVNNGRDNLQGAYTAQKEYNDTHPQTPICLDIANIGTNLGYEPSVVQQLVKAAAANSTIKGLIGWPGLLDSPASLLAVHLLEKAHLPIVSPDSCDEVQFVPDVFHIAPSSQDQGRRAALYAEQTLQKSRALIITDPANPYSRSLAEGFLQRFEEDGKQIAAIQTYTTGHTDARTLASDLQNSLASKPDVIYFAGGTDEGIVLLAQLRNDVSPLPLLGGDKLYSLVGYSEKAQPGLERLAITTAAYTDAPVAMHMKALYALDFDAQDPDRVRAYGYSRPDSDAILSYDAMQTLIMTYTNAAGLQSLLQALPSTRIDGASRKLITFTSLNELGDQSVFMLSVDQQEQIRFSTI
ncbi:MAG TPA: ABC transporter substrate-binding protein [Ktedonobacteraceae bacterium]|nr:ABC transporter substrate-binding protein [Ktedonobacteraceae bacterium]